MSITQVIQVHAVSTLMELTKVVEDKYILQEKYDQIRLERDESA
jgi:hypothetical protein